MSDFEASTASISLPRSYQSNAALPLGGVAVGTLSLGFLEACLHIERRPIPLRFATAFALSNALPSAVWQSISARHVAASLRIPLHRVFGCNAASSSLSASERATRIILLKTTRCLRYGLASYGLAWSLYKLAHTEDEEHEPSSSLQILPPESILRLAPVDSALSVASLAKHGAKHVALVPDHTDSRSIDWSKLGLNAVGSSDRLLVVEIELPKSSALAEIPLMLQEATKSCKDSMLTVAVLSGFTTSLSSPSLAGVDVCISAMSGILQCVTDLCERQQVDHARIFVDDEESTAANGFSASDLSRALLHQCGIKPSALTMQEIDDSANSPDTQSAYVIVAKTPAAGRSIAEKLMQRGVVQETICVIVEESLRGSRWRAEGVTRFSSSDFCDDVLQQTREMARSGRSAGEIQTSIYQKYGMQRALGSRSDQYSDITKYI